MTLQKKYQWGLHGATHNLPTVQDSVTSDADILSAVNVQSYPDGQAVNLAAVFGNSMTFDASGDVAGARAVVQVSGG